jgi:NAD(P)-dependent dehydrogenase (short-subunit alcohol dehydrogenase family)
MRSVVITGASTGIGWATAKLVLERGLQTFGCERVGDRGDQAPALLDLLLEDLFFVHGIPQASGGSTRFSVTGGSRGPSGDGG